MRDYTNYHNINYIDKLLHDSNIHFQRTLEVSPESYAVTVNGEEHRVIIQSTRYPDQRDIIFHISAINHGDIVVHEGLNWLVIDRPFNNRLYEKSRIRLCNEVVAIKEKTERKIIGYDEINRPIYGDEETIFKEIPCVVEDRIQTVYQREGAVNLPEDRLSIHMPYDESISINLNTTLTVFGDKYRIYSIDKSNIYNGVGVLQLYVERTK